MFENRYTVVHDQHGPVLGMVIGKLLSSGERFVGLSEDQATMQRMMRAEMVGVEVVLSTDDKTRGHFELLQQDKPRL